MKLQNNYIFLLFNSLIKKSKTKPKTKSDGTIVLTLPKDINTTLDRCFENINLNKEESTPFNALFSVTTDEKDCTASIVTFTINENVYLNLTVEAKTKATAIKVLESLHKQITECENINKDYVPIISYDSISEHYCNKLYPKINRMERLLRRLCFNIYILNFGANYYQATIKQEIQDRAKKNIRNKSEIYRLQLFFYSLDFNDIETILFTPQWLDSEESRRCDILKNKDLAQLTDKELREAFEYIKPKSDWERFFSNKMPKIDAFDLIHQIHKYRNNVAHSKFLYKDDYVLCSKLLNKLIRSIENAITLTEEEDFAKITFEKLQASITRVIKAFEDFNNGFPNIFDAMTKSITAALDKLSNINIPNIIIPDIKFPEFKIPSFDFDKFYNNLNFNIFDAISSDDDADEKTQEKIDIEKKDDNEENHKEENGTEDNTEA